MKMAEKTGRSKLILTNALAARRKLCFDSEELGEVRTNSVQDHTPEYPSSNYEGSFVSTSARLANQDKLDKVRQPITLIKQSTSNTPRPPSSCIENKQPKSCIILSNIPISGPSKVPTSVCEKKKTELETNQLLLKPPSTALDISGKNHNLEENIEVNHFNIENPDATNILSLNLEGPVKPLSPIIININDNYNIINISPSKEVSYDTLQNVNTVEFYAPDVVHKENNSVTDETAPNLLKKNKRKQKISYLDYMSDNEDFQRSSTSWDGEDTSSSSEEETNEKRKKRKKTAEDGKVGDLGLRKKKTGNKRKENTIKRDKGLAYVKKNGKETVPKAMKENPCKSDKKCPHNCHEISEERRKNIFNYYYNISSQRKRDWLVVNSQTAEVKRKRTKGDASRRQKTYLYFINEGEGRRQVCQKFLLYTLDLSQRFVHYTISNAEFNLSKTDIRGKHVPANKTSASIRQEVIDYIKNLPAVPSHYCRKDSTRLYLPQEFKNITHLYQLYKNDFSSKGKDYVGEKVFKNIFSTEFNITFHIPKKDKCKKCVAFAYNPTDETEEEKKVHLKEVEDSKARFKFHQNITKHETYSLCVSFDLQKVLNTPYGESMLFYYSRKYSVYNLTFYESSTREGYCYSWGESDGKRGGNEVATILLKYIQMVDDRKTIKNLLLYSDSCSGQNKNKIVFAAVHPALLACEHIETIQMNFLLPGHTSMPVDSIHAVIENSLKNIVVHAPSQWSTVFTLARKNPKPYNVEILKYSDFVAWDSISDKYFKNNLAGKISKIRVITFKKSDPTHVFIKNSMGQEAKTEKVFVLRKNKMPSQRLYKSQLPICDLKYKDLVNHCKSSAIPHQFHEEYFKLPHGNVKDHLPDTDVEDSD